MTIPGNYLVNNTVSEMNALLAKLGQCDGIIRSTVQRMEALGVEVAQTYDWQNGYTLQDFIDLYQELDALPELLVATTLRDKIMHILSAIQ